MGRKNILSGIPEFLSNILCVPFLCSLIVRRFGTTSITLFVLTHRWRYLGTKAKFKGHSELHARIKLMRL